MNLRLLQGDRSKIMEEREKLQQMLDEKDDEIQEQSCMVEKLKEQMLEQEELIGSARRDYENLTKEMSKIQAENDSAKDEVKDVLQVIFYYFLHFLRVLSYLNFDRIKNNVEGVSHVSNENSRAIRELLLSQFINF